MSAARKELESSLTKLSITSDHGNKFQPKRKPIADSWEEEASGSETEGEAKSELSNIAPTASSDYPQAPPPTPISPSSPSVTRDTFISPYGSDSGSGERKPERRQEKTDAVAKRMIAGALGVRAPKKTEEQKAYEKAVREKEIKRRNAEKEREAAAAAEAERLKAAAWED